MAKIRLTVADHEAAHSQFLKAVNPELTKQGLGRLRSRIKGDGAFTRRVSHRLYAKFVAEGGKVGDWQAWVKYLLENLPAIIAALMAIFA